MRLSEDDFQLLREKRDAVRAAERELGAAMMNVLTDDVVVSWDRGKRGVHSGFVEDVNPVLLTVLVRNIHTKVTYWVNLDALLRGEGIHRGLNGDRR